MVSSWNVEETALITNLGQENVQSWFNAIKHSSYCIRSYVMVIFLLFSFAWSYAIDSHYPFIIHIYTYIGHLQETIMRITCGRTWFEFNVNLPNLLSMYYLICIRVGRPKVTLIFSDCHQKFNVRSYNLCIKPVSGIVMIATF